MPRRSYKALSIFAVAGLTAAAIANPAGTWEWTWVHVEPGSTNEITPQVPGKVSPGEAVEFRGTFSYTGMGTIQTSQSTGQSGPIAGLHLSNLNFIAGANHGGAFYQPITRTPAAPGIWPVIVANRILEVGIGQFAFHGQPLANTSTIFSDAVRIRWDPVSYDNRVVSFHAEKSLHGTGGPLYTGGSAYIVVDPVEVIYAAHQFPVTSWGSLQVPIIPSPSGLSLLGLFGVVAVGRHRRAGVVRGER